MEWWTVIAALVGVGLVYGPLWRITRGWVTLGHEVGHALAALLAEADVRRIRVELDTSGVTEWSGKAVRRRIPRGFVAWWGYPAPCLGAVLVAAAVRFDHATTALTIIAVAATVVGAVWIRSAWGAVLSVSLLAVAALGASYGDQWAQAVAVGIATVWGVGGLRAAIGSFGQARRGDGSDQATLAEMLALPVSFWSTTMVAFAAVCVVASVALVAPVAT